MRRVYEYAAFFLKLRAGCFRAPIPSYLLSACFCQFPAIPLLLDQFHCFYLAAPVFRIFVREIYRIFLTSAYICPTQNRRIFFNTFHKGRQKGGLTFGKINSSLELHVSGEFCNTVVASHRPSFRRLRSLLIFRGLRRWFHPVAPFWGPKECSGS